ncbi:MAG: leucine-rich repeat protein [Christensenellales bacterium]
MKHLSAPSVLLALLLTVTLGLLTAFAEGSETAGTTEDGIKYSIADGVATITGYSGTATALSIPSMVQGVAVRGIGDGAFQDRTSLQSVVIPFGITNLGYSAFSGCNKLSSISIPDGVLEIKDYCFRECSLLKDVKLPQSITVIPNQAFYLCESLASISLPSHLKEIGNYAFGGCAFTSITLPGSLTRIGDSAFSGCGSLATLSFPESLQSIGISAFNGCYKLPSLTIPRSVKSIGDNAFCSCISIESISLPSDLITVNGSCFRACNSLNSINVYKAGSGSNYQSHDGVLYNGAMSKLIAFPMNKGSSYAIPEGVAEIGSFAFAHDAWTKLGDLTIPDSLTRCAEDAFLLGSSIVLHLGNSEYMKEYAERKSITYSMGGGGDGSWIKNTNEKANWIVATYIKPGMSEFQKAVVLHDWLIGHVEYDLTYSKGTAYNALIEGSATCNGYTLAYALLLDKVGIPNQGAFGPNHIWNVIKLGGNWYHVDVQGDDSSWDNHTWFGVTDEMRQLTMNPIQSSVVCNSIEYNYNYRMGYYKEYLDPIKEKIRQSLNSGQLTYTFVNESDDWEIRRAYYQITQYDLERTEWLVNGRKYILAVQYDKGSNQFTLTFVLDPEGGPLPAIPGDANSDTTIDILDLVAIIDYIVSGTNPASPANADASGDGAVDIMDLVWIVDKIVGG